MLDKAFVELNRASRKRMRALVGPRPASGRSGSSVEKMIDLPKADV